MGAETKSKGTEIRTGRNGLWIPCYEWRTHSDPTYQFVKFFEELWQANGLDTNTGSSLENRTAYDHELVLPVVNDAPLLILKGSFVPREKSDVEYEARRSREREDWGQWSSVISGQEKYGIYMPPTEIGPLVPLLEVSYAHRHGGSGNDAYRYAASVMQLGHYISENDFPHDDHSTPVKELWQRTRDEYSERLHTLLDTTIEFLS